MNSGHWIVLFAAFLPLMGEVLADGTSSVAPPVGGCTSQVAVRADLLTQWTEKAVQKAALGKVPGTDDSLNQTIMTKSAKPLSKATYSGQVLLPKDMLGDVSTFGWIWRAARRKLNDDQAVVQLDIGNFKVKDFKLGGEKEWKWEKVDDFHQKIRVPIDQLTVTGDLKAGAATPNQIKKYISDFADSERQKGRAVDPEQLAKALKFDPDLMDPRFKVGIKGLKLTASKELNPDKEPPYIEFEVEANSARNAIEGIRVIPETAKISLPLKSMSVWLDMTPEQQKRFQDAAAAPLEALVGDEKSSSHSRGPQPAKKDCGGLGIWDILTFDQTIIEAGVAVKHSVSAASDELKKQGYTDNMISFFYLMGGNITTGASRADNVSGSEKPAGDPTLMQKINGGYEDFIKETITPSVVTYVNEKLRTDKDYQGQLKVDLPVVTLGQILGVPGEPDIKAPVVTFGGAPHDPSIAKSTTPTFPITVSEMGPDPSRKYVVGNLTTCPPEPLSHEAMGPRQPYLALDRENPIKEGYDVAGVISRDDLNRYLKAMTLDKTGTDAVLKRINSSQVLKGLQLDQRVRDLIVGPPQLIREWNPRSQKWDLSLEILRKTGAKPERVPVSDDMKVFDRMTGGQPISAETRTIAVKSLEVLSGVIRARSVEIEGLMLPDLDPNKMSLSVPKPHGAELKVLRASQDQDGVVFGVNLGTIPQEVSP